MTVKQMASYYYPKYWSKERLKNLVEIDKLSQADYEEIVTAYEMKMESMK